MTRLTPFNKAGLPASPVRRMVVTRAPHGVRPEIVVSLYPNGTVGLKEARRPARTEKFITLAELYVYLIERAMRHAEVLKRQYRREGLRPGEAKRMAVKDCGL